MTNGPSTTVTHTVPDARVPAPRQQPPSVADDADRFGGPASEAAIRRLLEEGQTRRPLPTDGHVGLWVEYALRHATGVC